MTFDGLEDGAPACAAAEVGEKGLGHLGFGPVFERGEAHDDPGRAETALARASRVERVCPLARPVEAGGRGHLARRHPPSGCHTGDAGLAVDQHSATAALALRTAPVLDAADAQAVAQNLEERGRRVESGVDLDGPAVENEGERQLKD